MTFTLWNTVRDKNAIFKMAFISGYPAINHVPVVTVGTAVQEILEAGLGLGRLLAAWKPSLHYDGPASWAGLPQGLAEGACVLRIPGSRVNGVTHFKASVPLQADKQLFAMPLLSLYIEGWLHLRFWGLHTPLFLYL